MLSLAPALRTLRLKGVYNSFERPPDSHSEERLARPACALANPLDRDQPGVTFTHYPLLRASATTLPRLDQYKDYSLSAGPNIVQALASNAHRSPQRLPAAQHHRRMPASPPPRQITALPNPQELATFNLFDLGTSSPRDYANFCHLRVLRFVAEHVDTSHKAYAK